MKSDAQMKNEIMEELLWDSTIKSRDIAARAAWHVPVVNYVEN